MTAADTQVSGRVARLADALTRYPFRRWGFGEDIGLRGLRALSAATGETRWAAFTDGLLSDWVRDHAPLDFKDHVTPGVPLLERFAETGDRAYLDAALELAALYDRFPAVNGIPVHRPDLEGWRTHIWVDSIYLDAPFLTRLWRATGEERWLNVGLESLRTSIRVLRDPTTRLFRHGYDAAAGEASTCLWGRGNGWALLGLVDTLEVLPGEHPASGELRATLVDLARALGPLQHPSGHWRTILDDPHAPLENSCAAFFALGLMRARRLGVLDDPELDSVARRALQAALGAVTPEGQFPVSEATPIGNADNYRLRPLGEYPWGAGPLLLAAAEGGVLGGGA